MRAAVRVRAERSRSATTDNETAKAALSHRLGYGVGLDDLRYLEVLVHAFAKPRRPVLLADVLVIWHTCEEVVAAGWEVGAVRPLLALKRHVALLLVLLQVLEQHRHAVPGRVLKGERDEDEADAQLAELRPRDGVLLVEPFEGRRIVEGESRLGKPLANLGAELLRRPALGGGELAPQQVRHAAVHVAEAAFDRQLDAAL